MSHYLCTQTSHPFAATACWREGRSGLRRCGRCQQRTGAVIFRIQAAQASLLAAGVEIMSGDYVASVITRSPSTSYSTQNDTSAVHGPKVAVTLAAPTPTPVTTAFSSTVKTAGSVDAQVASTVAEGPSS